MQTEHVERTLTTVQNAGVGGRRCEAGATGEPEPVSGLVPIQGVHAHGEACLTGLAMDHLVIHHGRATLRF